MIEAPHNSADTNMATLPIQIDHDLLGHFCRGNHIRQLSLYGSVLRSDFRADSDIDVLVEFEVGHAPGLLGIARMERELSKMFDGRKVDLRTPQDLSHYFRAGVVEQAELQYAQG